MLTNQVQGMPPQEPLTKPFTGEKMILPIVGATPADISQMLDLLDEGVPTNVPDVGLYETSYDECYLVAYDEHDHEFEGFVGVAWQ